MNLDSVFDTRRRATNSANEELTFQIYTMTGRYKTDDHSFLRLDLPYIDIDWERNNIPLDDSGVGDIRFSYSHDLHLDNSHTFLFTFGLELPTGDNSSDLNAASTAPITNVRPGSGTFDPFAGLTFLSKREGLNYYVNAGATVQGGSDDDAVELGDSFSMSVGIYHPFFNRYTIGASVDGIFTKPTRIEDVPLRNSGYSWLFFSLEQTFRLAEQYSVSLRLSYPFFRNVNGRQLAPDEILISLGLQMSF
ncbi:MAG: hypothetical protein HY606_12665 [Planctomycetes bacterium]|nr:hypothetical protein [Planctomycetota bacterium]